MPTSARTTWSAAAVRHLYRRAGFGASRERVARALDGGREAALDDLFARRDHDPVLMRGVQPLLALEEIEHLQAWWMMLILNDAAPLVERVALMWHDHFATSNDKVGDVRLMHAQIQLFRQKGLGDFRELLHAVARDPAMLVWLDGNANRRGNPNENFAREVLELFALGIGNYTESDVKEVARAFTGWGVDRRRFIDRADYHDPGEKQVLGVRGDFGGDEVIDVILAHPACAQHVARKLLAEFVVPQPAASDVEEWAGILVECEWSIERTLARLLRSELFESPTARRSRIAGPVEIVAGTAIALDARVVPRDAARATDAMGQALLRPPSVKGWDGGRAWIHAGSWLARHNYLSALVLEDERVDLSESLGSPRTKEEVSLAVTAHLLPDVTDDAFARVLAEAAREAGDVEEATRRVIALVLTSPEYHLA